MSVVPVLNGLEKTFGLEDVKFSRTCATCAFMDFTTGRARRICRRYPPNGATESVDGWPIVHAEDWCGEYLPVAANH